MTKVFRNAPNIEDFKPAEEIERLQNINADLLEVCKKAYDFFPYWYETETRNFIKQAISKVEGKEVNHENI